MIVTGQGADLVVREADNLTQLSLRVTEIEPGTEHAWLDIDALRTACGSRTTRWQSEFENMIAYADSKGWVDSGCVRAHLEVER